MNVEFEDMIWDSSGNWWDMSNYILYAKHVMEQRMNPTKNCIPYCYL